jgi:hypothetical protein
MKKKAKSGHHKQIEAILNKPTITKSAREAMSTKKPSKSRPKEDFNQAAFRAIQETIKRG